METRSSRGLSIWATRSSKYSDSPRNSKKVRAGRTGRATGGGRIRSGLGENSWNLMVNLSSLGKAAKHVTIFSGEMQPGTGMLKRLRVTRSLVDKRSVGSAG